MELLEEMRSEMDALAELYPQGCPVTDLCGYFGEPLAKIESLISTLEAEGTVCLKDQTVTFANPRTATARRNGRKGGLRRSEITLEEEKAANVRAFDLREALVAAKAEIGYSPSLEHAVLRVRDAIPMMAEHYPQGISAREMSQVLGMQPERCYRAIAQAVSEGWCEEVKAYGNRRSGHLAVFEGMLVPPPLLTDLQRKVYDWIKQNATDTGSIVLNMRQCAVDCGMSMVNDKLDSMERKGYIARVSRYQDQGKKDSPIYQVLPEPQPRSPEFRIGPIENAGGWDTRLRNAASREQQAREDEAMETLCDDPIAVIRARNRKADIEAEQKRLDAEWDKISEFLSMYERLSKKPRR